MSNSTDSFELPGPGSPAEDGAELHGPAGFQAHLTPMPAGMILFPRRMLYVEAVLYLLIAAASFGVGYLIARHGGSKAASKDTGNRAVESPVRLEGTVTSTPPLGEKRAEAGSLVIVLPALAAGKSLDKSIPAAGLRTNDPPAGPNSPAVAALSAVGGAMTRTGDDGRFTLSVPRPGPYRILIVLPHGTRESDALEQPNLKELGRYFDEPKTLLQGSPYNLQGSPYKWMSKDVRPGMDPIKAEFSQ